MAIDVNRDTQMIVDDWREKEDARLTQRSCEILFNAITSLVTRAVADAKREQMEADVDAVLFHSCNDPPEMCGSHHYVHAIRSAFAETEPTKEGNEIIEETLADGWPKNQQIAEQCIDARQRFDKAAVGIARNWHEQFGDKKNGPACCCGGCKLIAAARELGLDGDA